MKIEIIRCDLCGKEITPDVESYTLKTNTTNKKQVGCDIVLTPRGDRLHVRGGKVMIRISAGFYCGVHPGNINELHFHHVCLDQQVLKRILQFYRCVEEDGPKKNIGMFRDDAVPGLGTTWLYKDHDMVYTVVATTNLEHKHERHPPTVVYRGKNDYWWSMPLSEWYNSMTPLKESDNEHYSNTQ